MMLEAGLMRQPDAARSPTIFSVDRVIFPIRDGGPPIAFGGRTMGDGEPKYLNSPDTPLFDKRRTLFEPRYGSQGRLRFWACDRHRGLYGRYRPCRART